VFKSKHHDSTYEGTLEDVSELTVWAYDVCSPLVREITFENGEELTEQGLPFLILFYNPANPETLASAGVFYLLVFYIINFDDFFSFFTL
jgi:hypothetical protein